MNTTFLLSGGAGRIICSEPALREYHWLNPDDDFKVIIHGWSNLFHSHPILQNRTYDINMKGVFDLIVKDSNLVCPEPYHLWTYYNQKVSLAEAFNFEINNSSVQGLIPTLHLHPNEDATAQMMIQQAKQRYNKSKFIVFQPYGSGINDELEDSSGRSLTQEGFEYLVKKMSKELDAVVLYMGDMKHCTIDDESVLLTAKDVPGVDLRFFMSMIANSDYFVGVDSVGQHMARAFNIQGMVILGSTFETNVTYPDWFMMYRKRGFMPTYNPIRIAPFDGEMADRVNAGIMDFTKEELDEILMEVTDDMNVNFDKASNFNGNI